MRRESVLTDSDKDSIEIVKFIFHIYSVFTTDYYSIFYR